MSESEDKPFDERQGTSGKKAPSDIVTLRIEPKFSGTLKIDHSEYPVIDGVVEVPPWHVDAAKAAGYHP
jgi:hypothetical protein